MNLISNTLQLAADALDKADNIVSNKQIILIEKLEREIKRLSNQVEVSDSTCKALDRMLGDCRKERDTISYNYDKLEVHCKNLQNQIEQMHVPTDGRLSISFTNLKELTILDATRVF